MSRLYKNGPAFIYLYHKMPSPQTLVSSADKLFWGSDEIASEYCVEKDEEKAKSYVDWCKHFMPENSVSLIKPEETFLFLEADTSLQREDCIFWKVLTKNKTGWIIFREWFRYWHGINKVNYGKQNENKEI